MTSQSESTLQRRNYELAILNAIAQALNQSVDLQQALQAVLAKVAELFNMETGWVWLLHEESGDSYLAAAQNLPQALTAKPQRMEGACYCLRTYREGDLEGAANVNVVECSRLEGLVDGTDGLRYHASIPLYVHAKKLGVLNVASSDWRRLSPDDLRLLYTVGDLLGIAIERARLFDRSAQMGMVEERNRLAREIHDTLAQGLTAVSLHLESADALLEAGATAEQLRPIIQKALALTRTNLDEARRSVLDLRAAPLEGKTLIEALGQLARESGLPVTFKVSGSGQPLPPRVEIGLYRMVQELLTNTTRHAQATRVVIQLTVQTTAVHLLFSDNGCGFDPLDLPADRYGLRGLNERVHLLGGTLELKSTPGAGMRAIIVVPLV